MAPEPSANSAPFSAAGTSTDNIAGADLWTWRQSARAQAVAAGIAPQEVDWLLQQVCQVDALALKLGTVAQQAQVPCQLTLAALEQRWQRRVRDRVPIQHLAGQTPWRDLTLRVSPAVLIPRPETELIIEAVVEWVDRSPQAEQLRRGIWVDVGTGSGAIALALAQAFPAALVVATDVSAAALKLAQANAVLNGLGDRILFRQGSWFEPLARLGMAGQVAGMVSNPPYIPSDDIPNLQPEVARHEPMLALDGGVDGLDSIRHLGAIAPQFLISGGLWAVELMRGQAPSVQALLQAQGHYTGIHTYQDLAGIDRFVLAQTRV
jgi:release factor glutamine methyltransferase